MISTQETTIRILKFGGKYEDWEMWSRKFMAKAMKKKYLTVLTGTKKAPKWDRALDISKPNEKELMELWEANHEAYTDLTLSMTDQVPFGLVIESRTEDLPDGDAALAWKSLKAK